MNKEQVDGKWAQLMGKVQAKWGKLTHDHIAVIAGRRDQLQGKLLELYGIGKEELEKDLAEIPDNVKSGLEIRPVSSMEEVLRIALIREPTPVVWEDAEDAPPARLSGEADDPVVTLSGDQRASRQCCDTRVGRQDVQRRRHPPAAGPPGQLGGDAGPSGDAARPGALRAGGLRRGAHAGGG